MSTLPHFKMSKASMSAFEPVYFNHYEIRLTPPASIRNGTAWENTPLILENVISVKGLGSIEKHPGIVEQTYKGAKRSFAGGFPQDTRARVNISFEVNLDDNNQMYVYKALRAWADLVYNPLTGAMGVKKDYAGSGADSTQMTVLVYTKKGIVVKQINFKMIFPEKELPTIDTLEYENTNRIFKIENWPLIADVWEDVTR